MKSHLFLFHYEVIKNVYFFMDPTYYMNTPLGHMDKKGQKIRIFHFLALRLIIKLWSMAVFN